MPISTPIPIRSFCQEEFGKIAFEVIGHAKLINFGAEKIEHQFVNCHDTLEHRRKFEVERHRWGDSVEFIRFEETIVAFLRDWGTGLSRSLDEEACVHFFNEEDACPTVAFVETFWNERKTGRQPVKMFDEGSAFEITCMRENLAAYASHLRRFVENTQLRRILWANIVSGTIRFEQIG